MKAVLKTLAAILLTLSLAACQQHSEKKSTEENNGDKTPVVKIGIVLPLEHKALQEIVDGFTEELHTLYKHPVEIKIMNAQGDQNLQRAIIEQMRDEHYDLVIPVATGVTQMTASMIHDKPIVGIAADFPQKNRDQLKPCNIVTVHDEIPASLIINFIHATYPKIKQLVLIHSTSDKVYPDVQAAIAAGKANGITVKPIMVATLPDLVSATQSLPDNTQGIFILKDNLIVSGIATVAKAAEDKHIPLITSDEGSVEVAAGFAVGVREKQIGEEGAKLAAAVIAGDSICHIPIVEMKKESMVFINKAALQKESQNPDAIVAAAKKSDYEVSFVNDTAKEQ